MDNQTLDMPLVTFIVPAYNVQTYIKECVVSILKQDYDNIEVLIIDDGSADKTGEIVDALAKENEKVRVIHKANGGVSSARNVGIQESRGEFIVFVDGDDFIAPEYTSYMLNLAKKTGSDFCLSKHCFTKKGESQVDIETIETLDAAEATALLMSPAVIVGCWDKIYKKSLLTENKLLFSTNLFYGEGLSFITIAAQYANHVGVGNRKVYFYRRNNEFSATTKFDIAKVYNGERAIDKIEKELKVRNEYLETMIILHRCIYDANARVKIRANNVKSKYVEDDIRWNHYIRSNLPLLIKSKYVSVYRKLLLIGVCISPWLVMKMDIIRRKKIANNSVAR